MNQRKKEPQFTQNQDEPIDDVVGSSVVNGNVVISDSVINPNTNPYPLSLNLNGPKNHIPELNGHSNHCPEPNGHGNHL